MTALDEAREYLALYGWDCADATIPRERMMLIKRALDEADQRIAEYGRQVGVWAGRAGEAEKERDELKAELARRPELIECHRCNEESDDVDYSGCRHCRETADKDDYQQRYDELRRTVVSYLSARTVRFAGSDDQEAEALCHDASDINGARYAREFARIAVEAARPHIEENYRTTGWRTTVIEKYDERIARLEAALRGLINAPTGSAKEEHAAWCKAMDFAEQALAGEEA